MSMRPYSRRSFLAGAAKAAVLGVSGTAALSGVSAFATPLIRPPAPKAAGNVIPYGAAVRSDALVSDLSYRDAVIAGCQLVVPESELKWLELRPSRDQYRFEKADAIMDFARQNGIDVRGHTLAWYGAMPAWTDAIASRAEAERELVTHSRPWCPAIAARFRRGTSSTSRWPNGPRTNSRSALRSGRAGCGRIICRSRCGPLLRPIPTRSW